MNEGLPYHHEELPRSSLGEDSPECRTLFLACCWERELTNQNLRSWCYPWRPAAGSLAWYLCESPARRVEVHIKINKLRFLLSCCDSRRARPPSGGCIWLTAPPRTFPRAAASDSCRVLPWARTPGSDTLDTRRRNIRTNEECWDDADGTESLSPSWFIDQILQRITKRRILISFPHFLDH